MSLMALPSGYEVGSRHESLAVLRSAFCIVVKDSEVPRDTVLLTKT